MGLKKIYYFLVHTNLLIAFAAVAQCALTYYVLNFPVNSPILWIEGATTLLLYNLSLYLSLPKDPRKSPYQRTRWIGKNMWLFWTFSAVSFLITIWALFHVHFLTLVFLGFIGVISLAYAVPLLKTKGKWISMRQVPGLKVFYIALVWSLSSVGLPVVELYANDADINWYTANYLGLVKIVFLVLCTLPFDIRDYEQDSLYNLKTVPILLGKERAINLSYGIGLFHLILIALSPNSLNVKIGLLLTTMLILIMLRFIIYSKEKHYHHVYLLDLSLVIQWLLVFLFIKL
jgi:4-hydroxybenzoate polyprenyltransferase